MPKLITFISLAVFLPCCLTNCSDNAIDENSGSCYKTIKPILEYFSIVEKDKLRDAGHILDVVGRLEKIEAKLANASLDHQLRLLKNIETHVESQVKPNEREDFQARIGKLESQLASQQEKLSFAESLSKESERKLEEQLHLVEIYKADRLKKFQKILSKYYYIEQHKKLSWESASNTCKQMGSHLINLQDNDEFTAVSNKLTPDQIYWTAINDRDTENKFVTQTGEVANFLKWRQQPDNYNNEDCVELLPKHNGMNDNNCEGKYYFICEISPELKIKPNSN